MKTETKKTARNRVAYAMPIVENKVFYVAVQKANPQNRKTKKYYAQVRHSGRVTIDTLKDNIAGQSSLSRGDVGNVLDNLMEAVAMHLRNGRIVELGDLGKMYISVSSKGCVDKKELASADICKTRLRFAPSNRLKEVMNTLSFMRLTELKKDDGKATDNPTNTNNPGGEQPPSDEDMG